MHLHVGTSPHIATQAVCAGFATHVIFEKALSQIYGVSAPNGLQAVFERSASFGIRNALAPEFWAFKTVCCLFKARRMS